MRSFLKCHCHRYTMLHTWQHMVLVTCSDNMISVFGVIVNINCTRVKVEGRWYSVHWLTRQWCGNRRLWLSVYRYSQMIGWRRDGCSRPWFGIQNIWSSFPLAIGSSFVASNTLYGTMAGSFHNKLLLYTSLIQPHSRCSMKWMICSKPWNASLLTQPCNCAFQGIMANRLWWKPAVSCWCFSFGISCGSEDWYSLKSLTKHLSGFWGLSWCWTTFGFSLHPFRPPVRFFEISSVYLRNGRLPAFLTSWICHGSDCSWRCLPPLLSAK